jgi:hypothetical protein
MTRRCEARRTAGKISVLIAPMEACLRRNPNASGSGACTVERLNVAEGTGCTTDGEFGRFLSYTYRSLEEVVTGLG